MTSGNEGIFDGLRICTTGFSESETRQIFRLIRSGGGQVSSVYRPKAIDVLIVRSTNDSSEGYRHVDLNKTGPLPVCNIIATSESGKPSSKLLAARLRGIPTVTLNWVNDSIESNKLLPVVQYLVPRLSVYVAPSLGANDAAQVLPSLFPCRVVGDLVGQGLPRESMRDINIPLLNMGPTVAVVPDRVCPEAAQALACGVPLVSTAWLEAFRGSIDLPAWRVGSTLDSASTGITGGNVVFQSSITQHNPQILLQLKPPGSVTGIHSMVQALRAHRFSVCFTGFTELDAAHPRQNDGRIENTQESLRGLLRMMCGGSDESFSANLTTATTHLVVAFDCTESSKISAIGVGNSTRAEASRKRGEQIWRRCHIVTREWIEACFSEWVWADERAYQPEWLRDDLPPDMGYEIGFAGGTFGGIQDAGTARPPPGVTTNFPDADLPCTDGSDPFAFAESSIYGASELHPVPIPEPEGQVIKGSHVVTAESLVMSPSAKLRSPSLVGIIKRSRPTVVLSGLSHPSQAIEQAELRSALERAGCFVSALWTMDATHLIVVGDLARTDKLLAAVASGCWVLRRSWVDSGDCTRPLPPVDPSTGQIISTAEANSIMADAEMKCQSVPNLWPRGQHGELNHSWHTERARRGLNPARIEEWRSQIQSGGSRPFSNWLVFLDHDVTQASALELVLSAGGGLVARGSASDCEPQRVKRELLSNYPSGVEHGFYLIVPPEDKGKYVTWANDGFIIVDYQSILGLLIG